MVGDAAIEELEGAALGPTVQAVLKHGGEVVWFGIGLLLETPVLMGRAARLWLGHIAEGGQEQW